MRSVNQLWKLTEQSCRPASLKAHYTHDRDQLPETKMVLLVLPYNTVQLQHCTTTTLCCPTTLYMFGSPTGDEHKRNNWLAKNWLKRLIICMSATSFL